MKDLRGKKNDDLVRYKYRCCDMGRWYQSLGKQTCSSYYYTFLWIFGHIGKKSLLFTMHFTLLVTRWKICIILLKLPDRSSENRFRFYVITSSFFLPVENAIFAFHHIYTKINRIKERKVAVKMPAEIKYSEKSLWLYLF